MAHPIHRYFINHLSAGEFVLLLVIIMSLLAVVIFFCVRKYLSFLVSTENTKFISVFVTSVTANYAFILGFIIVTLWKDFDQVDTFVTQESEFLSTMLYGALAFPAKVQTEAMKAIEQYIHAVVYDEWPAMRAGHASPAAEAAVANLYHVIQSYSPETKIESAFYDQFIKDLTAMSQYRGRRLEYLHTTLIDIIRYMLFLGIFLIVFLLSLIKVQRLKIQIVSILVVSTMLSFNLGLALLFDYPLAGSIAVSPEPFTNGVLERFNPKNQ